MTKTFHFQSQGFYTVNPLGQLISDRPVLMDRPSKPSGQWLARGICRFNNFGHIVEVITFNKWEEKYDYICKTLKYKNGKGQWHIMDHDHGTNRIWGRPIHSFTMRSIALAA